MRRMATTTDVLVVGIVSLLATRGDFLRPATISPYLSVFNYFSMNSKQVRARTTLSDGEEENAHAGECAQVAFKRRHFEDLISLWW